MLYKKSVLWILGFSTLLMLGISDTVLAQKQDSKPPDVKLEITKVSENIERGEIFNVTVDKLRDYLKQPGKDVEKFTLYLNGKPLKGLDVGWTERKTNEKKVESILLFSINPTAESKAEWGTLMSYCQI